MYDRKQRTYSTCFPFDFFCISTVLMGASCFNFLSPPSEKGSECRWAYLTGEGVLIHMPQQCGPEQNSVFGSQGGSSDSWGVGTNHRQVGVTSLVCLMSVQSGSCLSSLPHAGLVCFMSAYCHSPT